VSIRFAPRGMEVGALVKVLVEEHKVMKKGLLRARDAARAGDFGGATQALRDVVPVFRQHIADEEAQILGLLVRRLGAKGAEEEIAVFRQHRPIYALMVKIGELAASSSAELEGRQEELEKMFEDHASLEETRVFPKAASLSAAGVSKRGRG
jgi:hypothetical protein